MDKKDLLLKNVSNLIGKTSFYKDEDHMLYSVHKMFDIIERYGMLDNDETLSFEEDEIILRIHRIIPPIINLKAFFKENNNIWSQEHKNHYQISIEQYGSRVKFNIKVDRISKPAVVFKKEFETKDYLAEAGLNKWNN